jgi:citrate lyase subunit beta/citryl-CoA lyase
MTRELPLWRSLLYVPANVERFVEKAHLRGADGIQLDLEDAIAAADKSAARAAVPAAAARARRGGADVLVRINRPLGLAVRDIEAAIGPDVYGLVVPKVDGAGHLRLIDQFVGEVERERGLPPGHTRLVALVESAAAWPRLHAIARASPRLVALNMGNEDFALDCGIEPDAETLQLPKQQLVMAAAAAGILPLGVIGSTTQFDDLDSFRANVARSRRFGFTGASCIHPGQVAVLNEAFSPTADELARARRVVQALQRDGARGAVALDGRMIDAPIAARAQRLLALQAAIERRQAQARTAGAAGGTPHAPPDPRPPFPARPASTG